MTEIDFEDARSRMVNGQIRTTDVTSHVLLDALFAVPREAFVPPAKRDLAYIDEDLELSSGRDGVARYLMEPSPLARMIQLADVQAGDVALDVGCATGYASALLSLLATSVIALESDTELADRASQTLMDLGYDNVAVVTSGLEEGCPDEAPFDVIFVGGAVERLPQALFDQLRDGGRMVAVEGLGNAAQAILHVKHDGVVSSRPAFNAAIKPLPGFRKTEEFQF